MDNFNMRIERALLYSGGQRIVGILHLPDGDGKFPCVITCHGYYSTKDSEKYVAIANRLCGEGFAVFRFDFRGCGESEGSIEEITLSGRVSDLESALWFVRKHAKISGRIGLLGSSMGGCVAIIRAAEDEGIKAVAAWSTPSHLSGLFEKDRLKRDVERYRMLELVGRVAAPILIIHGDADELVPLHHAKDLYERANEPKMLEIIKGGDHRLTNPQDRKRAIDLSLEWFKKYLQNEHQI